MHCLRQNGIAADEASHILLLSAETLAAPNNDDNPLLTSDDKDKLEANKLIVEDTQWH